MSSDISDTELDEIIGAEKAVKEKPISSSLLRFIDPDQLKKDVSFSEHNLDDAMSQQAALYSYYASQAAKAQLQADRAKNQVEIVEAKLYRTVRNANAGKKITETAVLKEIMLDRRYIAAVKRYNEAKMIAALARESTEALKQRRDMLIQTSKHHLEGQKGELFLKSKEKDIEDKKRSALAKIGQNN
ncbi:MAG: hypothetical protein ABJG42_24455 [Vibrio splendidus]